MPPVRKTPRVSDLMILVAATAVGLTIFNLVDEHLLWQKHLLARLLDPHLKDGWTTGRVVVHAVEWAGASLSFTCAWTATALILRLRAPRPSSRHLRREPGFIACLAVMIAMAWAALALGLVLGLDTFVSARLLRDTRSWLFHFVVEELFPYIGLAVATAWIVLWVTGQWTRPADWIDRFGRLLGAYWIVVGMVWSCRRYLPILVY